jgi:hypothetical protein
LNEKTTGLRWFLLEARVVVASSGGDGRASGSSTIWMVPRCETSAEMADSPGDLCVSVTLDSPCKSGEDEEESDREEEEEESVSQKRAARRSFLTAERV